MELEDTLESSSGCDSWTQFLVLPYKDDSLRSPTHTFREVLGCMGDLVALSFNQLFCCSWVMAAKSRMLMGAPGSGMVFVGDREEGAVEHMNIVTTLLLFGEVIDVGTLSIAPFAGQNNIVPRFAISSRPFLVAEHEEQFIGTRK
jgi:hypothetical protein